MQQNYWTKFVGWLSPTLTTPSFYKCWDKLQHLGSLQADCLTQKFTITSYYILFAATYSDTYRHDGELSTGMFLYFSGLDGFMQFVTLLQSKTNKIQKEKREFLSEHASNPVFNNCTELRWMQAKRHIWHIFPLNFSCQVCMCLTV